MSSGARERGGSPIHQESPTSFEGTADARETPISPKVVNHCVSSTQRDFLVGATESARVPAAAEPLSASGAVEPLSAPEVTYSDGEEVEE